MRARGIASAGQGPCAVGDQGLEAPTNGSIVCARQRRVLQPPTPRSGDVEVVQSATRTSCPAQDMQRDTNAYLEGPARSPSAGESRIVTVLHAPARAPVDALVRVTDSNWPAGASTALTGAIRTVEPEVKSAEHGIRGDPVQGTSARVGTIPGPLNHPTDRQRWSHFRGGQFATHVTSLLPSGRSEASQVLCRSYAGCGSRVRVA